MWSGVRTDWAPVGQGSDGVGTQTDDLTVRRRDQEGRRGAVGPRDVALPAARVPAVGRRLAEGTEAAVATLGAAPPPGVSAEEQEVQVGVVAAGLVTPGV